MIPMRQSNATSQNSLLVPDEDSGGPAATSTGGPGRRSRRHGSSPARTWRRQRRLAAASAAAPRDRREGRRHPARWGIGRGLPRSRRAIPRPPRHDPELLVDGGPDRRCHARHRRPARWMGPLGRPGQQCDRRRHPLSDFDDPDRYPNIAVVRFPGADPVRPRRGRRASHATHDRGPARARRRLARVRVGDRPTELNPLLEGMGHPGAVLVETAVRARRRRADARSGGRCELSRGDLAIGQVVAGLLHPGRRG